MADHACNNNDSHPPPVAQLQIIADDQQFTKELPDYVKGEWKLRDAGFDYNLVAVFGLQSTGKSTLLNKLFLTTFDVMSEAARRQTTKGIWMSEARTPDPDGGDPVPNGVLVMDVEGTDGRERGEDQDFERKSALFSLAVAQVIIVNMWEHMVGLYNGANMGLLKTMFEVNLQLFHGGQDKEQESAESAERRTKTLLLFVIRDHIGQTPLEDLSRTLTKDLESIWAGLTKPKGLEGSIITDFFDLMFSSLPHKNLMSDKFDDATDKLRNRFTDKSDKDYVFRPIYHKRIPADGFSHYAESIWAKIVSNKDLDLPTQQELLAQYRCDEIASAALAVFSDAVAPYRVPIEGGRIVEELGPATARARNELMSAFDRDASRYHALIYKRKRAELLRSANTTLGAYFLGQLKNLGKKVLDEFSTDLDERLNATMGSLGSLNGSFLEHVKSARELAEKYFLSQAEAICLSDTDWSYSEQLSQLREEMDVVATHRRGEEVSKIVSSLERNFVRDISESLSKHLNEPSPTMWTQVIEDYKLAYDRAKEKLIKRAKSEFEASNEETVSAICGLRRNAWAVLTKKVSEETSDSMIMAKLRDKFDELFRYDENGLPPVWKPGDDIDGTYRRAKEAGDFHYPISGQLPPTDPEHYMTILGGPSVASILNFFDYDSDRESDREELGVFFVGDSPFCSTGTRYIARGLNTSLWDGRGEEVNLGARCILRDIIEMDDPRDMRGFKVSHTVFLSAVFDKRRRLFTEILKQHPMILLCAIPFPQVLEDATEDMVNELLDLFDPETWSPWCGIWPSSLMQVYCGFLPRTPDREGVLAFLARYPALRYPDGTPRHDDVRLKMKDEVVARYGTGALALIPNETQMSPYVPGREYIPLHVSRERTQRRSHCSLS